MMISLSVVISLEDNNTIRRVSTDPCQSVDRPEVKSLPKLFNFDLLVFLHKETRGNAVILKYSLNSHQMNSKQLLIDTARDEIMF